MLISPPLHELMNYLPEGVIIVDERGAILFANDAFSEMVGYESALLIGLNMLTLLVDVDVFGTCIATVMEEGKSLNAQTDFLHRNGSLIRTVKSVRMIRDSESFRFFVNVRNLTDTDRLNQELRQSHRLIECQAGELSALLNSKHQELEEILGSIHEVIWYIDSQTLSLRYVNDAVEAIFGFFKEEFLADKTLWQRQIHPDDRALVKTFFETLSPGKSQEICFRILRSDSETRWLNSRIHHHETLSLFIGITSDVTAAKSHREEITFLAYHDPLTQLPNRAKLKEKLTGRFEHSAGEPFTLLFLDLDNFKNINDTMGHEIGDSILVEVSRRFRERIDPDHFCARFGGDEFVLLLTTTEPSEIERFCARLIETFKEPFVNSDIDFYLSASIGIVCYPQDAKSGEDLIKYADTAMYEAKKRGKNRFAYYHSSMQHAIADFLHVESLVRDALTHGYFELYFQPLVESKTLQTEGYEALLRLPHPREGFIPPDRFIPVAETNGDILTIGREVLRQACDFIDALRSLRSEPFFVAINVSAKELHQENFSRTLLGYLKERGIPSSYVKVELTESTLMNNLDIAGDQLLRLKAGGIRIALDDFGTGYSSFAYLAQLPIDTLKIDKSFILSLFDVHSHRHIVEAISTLAHVLGMSVTAEGVEESAHFDFLLNNRIDTLQGFHLGRPVPPHDILRRI